MQLLSLAILLCSVLFVHAIPQDTWTRVTHPKLQRSPLPSKTSYSTAINGPGCTGCLLEAIQPTTLSYPGTVYCVNVTFISTVPSVVRYTVTESDGCTKTTTRPYTYNTTSGPISTTSITWSANGTSLTWPTTYIAYGTFEAGTWSQGGGPQCTIDPTTVFAQSPIIYPASSLPASFAPVPSQVVQSIIHDPSISLQFDISTCTANGALPNPLLAELEPDCSCTTKNTPSPSCIRLPPITSPIPNTFNPSGYYKSQVATPPAQIQRDLDSDKAARSTSYEERYTSYTAEGSIDG